MEILKLNDTDNVPAMRAANGAEFHPEASRVLCDAGNQFLQREFGNEA